MPQPQVSPIQLLYDVDALARMDPVLGQAIGIVAIAVAKSLLLPRPGADSIAPADSSEVGRDGVEPIGPS